MFNATHAAMRLCWTICVSVLLCVGSNASGQTRIDSVFDNASPAWLSGNEMLTNWPVHQPAMSTPPNPPSPLLTNPASIPFAPYQPATAATAATAEILPSVSAPFHRPNGLWHRIVQDHRNFYDRETLAYFGGGLLVGGIFANTSIDDGLQRHFQASIRGATSDDWFEFLHANKELGNGRYTLPIFAVSAVFGKWFDQYEPLRITGEWGERSLRTFTVGVPSVIAFQRLTGASRPGESSSGSHWKPFDDNNGVSGHAFMSALPFINAAKMTDRPLLKATFYGLSLLGPLSRVNDDAHYTSQVALGWWIAYLAATAIDDTQLQAAGFQLTATQINGNPGVGLIWKY